MGLLQQNARPDRRTQRSAGDSDTPRRHATPGRVPPTLADRYADVRGATESLCDSLEVEDLVVSSMADVSPTKWHLAHTSWFFET
ncbi:MAG TPA: hypothetical protein VF461_04265, partial [Gemmatimonadaceae bacterium]